MKQRILFFALAILSSGTFFANQEEFDVDHEGHEVLPLCENPTVLPYNQKNIIISTPGAYTIDRNITATIFITTNDVCLDLQNFTLTGQQGNPAIAVAGTQDKPLLNVMVQNGVITLPHGLGVRVSYTTACTLKNLTFFNVNEAAVFQNVTLSLLKNITSKNNTNTTGRMISIVDSEDMCLHTVDLSHNILKRSAATQSPFNGVLVISGSQEIQIRNSKIKHNICQDAFDYEAFLFTSGQDLKIINSTFDGNGSVAPSSSNIVGGLISNATDIAIKHTTFNGTYAQKGSQTSGLFLNAVDRVCLENTQANDTTLQTASLASSTLTPFSGARGFLVANCNHIFFNHCQANSTTHEKNLCSNAPIINGPAGLEQRASTDCTYKRSTFNGSIIKAVDSGCIPAKNQAYGFLVAPETNSNVAVSDCQASQSSGPSATGFHIESVNGATLRKSVANNQKATDTTLGNASGFTTVNTTLLSLSDCTAKENIGHIGTGFSITSTLGLTLQRNKASTNSTDGFVTDKVSMDASAGDIKIFGNCARENGANGFLFTLSTLGAQEKYLVLFNMALDNELCGFNVAGTNAAFSSTWVGNVAESNNPNYCLNFTIPVEQTLEGGFSCKDCPLDFANISSTPELDPYCDDE